jgi:hypothetical protein
MIKGEDEGKVAPFGPAPASGGERLPYAIELWDLPRAAPEKLLGRAASMVLARAIFAAAATEHLGRRLVLRRGSKVLLETD